MIIGIAGTPGTGKSTVARLIARYIPAEVIDANALMVKEGLYVRYDRSRKTYDILPRSFNKRILKLADEFNGKKKGVFRSESAGDRKIGIFFQALYAEHSLFIGELRTKLANQDFRSALRGSLKPNPSLLIIDSHLTSCLRPDQLDYLVVVQTSLKTLKNRLKRRKYSRVKVQENLEAEAFESSLIEAQEKNHKIILITS